MMFFAILLACNVNSKTPTDTIDCCDLIAENRIENCSSEEINSCSENPCYSKTPQVHIGTGEYEWKELSEGDSVMMVHGPQGGWHMLGSIWLENSAQIVEVSFQIYTMENIVISDNNYRVAMVMEEECVGFYPGMFGYLNVSELEEGNRNTPPELLADTQVRFEIQTNDCSNTMNDRGECSRDGRWSKSTIIVNTELDPQDIESTELDTGTTE